MSQQPPDEPSNGGPPPEKRDPPPDDVDEDVDEDEDEDEEPILKYQRLGGSLTDIITGDQVSTMCAHIKLLVRVLCMHSVAAPSSNTRQL